MTDDLPEMRASDAERERIAEVLRDALAEGRLGLEEFQERLDSAYAARTRGELVPLVRDLPQHPSGDGAVSGFEGGGSEPAPSPGRRRRWTERIGGAATSRWGVGVMGGFGRKGQWTVPRVFTALGIMGGGEIDLRDARFEDREVVIRCFALMGGMSVTVPPGLGVEVRGIGVMGGFDASGSVAGDPDAPRVVITGFTVMGGVGVVKKLPREEKKQLRDERRAQRELERRGEEESGERVRRPEIDKPHGAAGGWGHGGSGAHGSHGGDEGKSL
jgi:hypothetical protein